MSRFLDDSDPPCVRTVYVRPGTTLDLYCECSTYFGSGFGMTRLTLEKRVAKDNGFCVWHSRPITFPEGSKARLYESNDPPGGAMVTYYEANLVLWRTQRRQHWAELFRQRRIVREYRAFRGARAFEIETRLRAVIMRHYELIAEAKATVAGRSGGRARRRAHQLRVAGEDQRRLAMALASTWIVEVSRNCNAPSRGLVDVGLESRKVRRELRSCCVVDWRVPEGCGVAVRWLEEAVCGT